MGRHAPMMIMKTVCMVSKHSTISRSGGDSSLQRRRHAMQYRSQAVIRQHACFAMQHTCTFKWQPLHQHIWFEPTLLSLEHF